MYFGSLSGPLKILQCYIRGHTLVLVDNFGSEDSSQGHTLVPVDNFASEDSIN